MRRILLSISLLLLCFSLPAQASSTSNKSGLKWQPWSTDIFKQAKASKRFVLLDLEAVWCHWCHVMEEKTYDNPMVAALLKKHYLLVRADQDAHPDLS